MADEQETNPGSTPEAAAPATEQAAKPDSADATAARTALEAKVGASLAALRDDADPAPAAKPKAQPAAELADEPEVESQAIEPAEKAEDEPEADGDGEAADDVQEQPQATGSTFPAAFRRSLAAYGWTDAEIDAAYKQSPDGFLVTASKIHKNRNDEVAAWAAAGRQAREQNQPNQEQEAPAANSRINAKTGQFKPIDVDALIEKHGNEELVRELAEPMNQVLETINALLPDLVTGVKSVQESRQQQLATQIGQFFGGKELEPYTDLYGKEGGDLTEDHFKARNKVLETADALVAGAKQQGRSIKINEALALAHDVVSAEHREKTIRSGIRKSVKTRNAGITLRPTAKSSDRTASPKNATELESRTRTRLAKVFG